MWEIQTGRCVKTFNLQGVVRSVAWCPNASLTLLAAAVDQHVYLINPGVGDRLVQAKTDEILKEAPQASDYLGKFHLAIFLSNTINCFRFLPLKSNRASSREIRGDLE